jgi:hypothetical protein
MNLQNLRWLFLFILTLEALESAGCRRGAATQQPAARNILIFLDLSESVRNAQRARWRKIGQTEIGRMGYGDSISIFGIHDRTCDAAPFYSGEIPFRPKDAGAVDLSHIKRILIAVKKDALAAFENALAEPARSKETDIFSAFDRYRSGADGRKPLLVILSDMQQATKEVNFERNALKASDFEQLILSERERRGWSENTLAEVKVCVVLPSAGIGQAKPLNSVRILRSFYSAMINSLGGELVSFDTHLQGGKL